jgi:RNA polymerase sigma-70 factor (ECF subfamily)
MQLFRKIGTFRGESAFSTWLHRLTVNIVLMHLRKKGLDEVPLDEESEDENQDLPKKEYGDSDLNLLGAVDRVTLDKAIADLPKGYRTIFVMHDVEGFEHNEIADIIGCSIGNSKSQLFKARLKLRAYLQNKGIKFEKKTT